MDDFILRLYLFQDFLDQLKVKKKLEMTLWQVDIELKDSEQEKEVGSTSKNYVTFQDTLDGHSPVLDDHDNAATVDDINEQEDIVVLSDESIMSTSRSTNPAFSSSDNSKFKFFDSSGGSEIVPPKIPSRVAWHSDVQIME